jgi:hypothetical protein
MRWLSSRVGTLVLALSAVALGACADRPKPTEASPPAGPDPLIIIGDGGDGGSGGGEIPPPPAPITIGSLTSADFEVAIDGPSVPYTATLNNPGPQRPNVALQGWITQGATRRAAGGQLVTCGLSAGVMPIGNCTAQGPIVASSTTAGSGAFVPGSATFELQLKQDGVVVGSRTVGVILVPNRPRISGVTLSADSVIIGGPGMTYTTSLQSPGPTRSNVRLRIYLGQATTHALVSDALVSCGGALGDVPKGACTIRGGFTTPDATIRPGQAGVEMQLVDNGTVLETRTSIVKSVSSTRLGVLRAGRDSVALGGSSVPYTLTLQNVGQLRSGMRVRTDIDQANTSSPSTDPRRELGLALVDCGSGPGVVPVGGCTVSGTFKASNTDLGISGSGTLKPGQAFLTVSLLDSTGSFQDAKSVFVTIIPNTLNIAGVSASSFAAVIDGASVPYTASLQNPGVSLSNIFVMASVIQGATRRDAGGTLVNCGSGSGVLSTGTCAVPSTFTASNTLTGIGTLVAGPATLQLRVMQGLTTVLYTTNLPVTLTSP